MRRCSSRCGVWAGRAVAVAFGLLLAIATLEVGLRVAALVVREPRPTANMREGTVSILTLGDSHTYGVFYSAEESYPGQLQALLDEHAPGRFQVINLGIPGMNSSEIVRSLPGWLARYEPAATVICVGVNNLWNDTAAAEPSGPVGFRSLRSWRLLRILDHRLRAKLGERPSERPDLERSVSPDSVEHRDAATGEVLVRHERRHEELEVEDGRRLLLRDLDRIDDLHRRTGVRMILLAYSTFRVPELGQAFTLHERMSDTLLAFGSERGLEVLDPRATMRRLVGSGPRASYFHSERDDHPNPAGYRILAELVAEALLAQEPLP